MAPAIPTQDTKDRMMSEKMSFNLLLLFIVLLTIFLLAG